MGLEGIGISSNVANSVAIPVPAPSGSRGVIVELGKATGVQFNSVAPTTIFTTVAGFTRCRVTSIVVGNISGVCTTASFSFGQSGTPTDWAATATYAGLSAAGKFITIAPSTAAGQAEITGTGVAFVVNVTIGQGVATTGDVIAFGFYE